MNDVLESGLAGPLASMGVDLEAVEVQKAGRRHVVRIVVDRDGGVDLDTVADVSRKVSDLLDAEPLSNVLPGPFVLEVSSPGVDRPLTLERHWRRAATRLVEVHLVDGAVMSGRITGTSQQGLELDVAGTPTILTWSDVSHGIVQVEFNRPGEVAGVLDAESAHQADDDHPEEA